MLNSLGRGLTYAATNTSSQLSPIASIDSALKTVALIGDSITSQNDSSNKQEFTSQGYMTWLNALTGQRYYYDPSYNLSASGQAIASTLSNITDLAALSPAPDLVFYIPFANDITGSRSYADLIADLDAIIAYVTGALGAKMVIGTPLPRTQDNGNALTTAQQTLSNNLRNYIMSLNISGVTPVNIYDNMTSAGDNPDTYLFDDEGGKYLHPTPAGAYQIALDMKDALDNVFGTNAIPDISICALGLNSDLSGTGGTEASPLTSAQVADNCRFYSYSGLNGALTKTPEGLQTPIFDALLEANENQVRRAFDKIKASGKKHVGMMGLSFKSGTDDLRESPLVTLANQLLDAGFTLSVYDPNVFHASRVESANQNYINNVITHISKNLVETPEQLKEKSEIYVIGNNGEQFSRIIQSIDDTKIPVLDLVRIDPAIESREGYHGICW